LKDKGTIPQYCGGAVVRKFDVAHEVNDSDKRKKRMILVFFICVVSSLVAHLIPEISFIANEAL
jgi:hypothetical protein